jgi:hypothetical protein
VSGQVTKTRILRVGLDLASAEGQAGAGFALDCLLEVCVFGVMVASYLQTLWSAVVRNFAGGA